MSHIDRVEGKFWYKNKQAGYAEEEEEESMFFMAHSTTIEHKIGVWFVDSGCSHHMTGERTIFKELDETKIGKLGLGIIRKSKSKVKVLLLSKLVKVK